MQLCCSHVVTIQCCNALLRFNRHCEGKICFMGNTKRVNTVKRAFHSNNIHGIVCTWHSGTTLQQTRSREGGGGEERERRRETELMPSLSLVEGVSFATAIHTEIRFNSQATLLIDQIKVHPCLWLEFAFQGSLYVSGKLLTYPSP